MKLTYKPHADIQAYVRQDPLRPLSGVIEVTPSLGSRFEGGEITGFLCAVPPFQVSSWTPIFFVTQGGTSFDTIDDMDEETLAYDYGYVNDIVSDFRMAAQRRGTLWLYIESNDLVRPATADEVKDMGREDAVAWHPQFFSQQKLVTLNQVNLYQRHVEQLLRKISWGIEKGQIEEVRQAQQTLETSFLHFNENLSALLQR